MSNKQQTDNGVTVSYDEFSVNILAKTISLYHKWCIDTLHQKNSADVIGAQCILVSIGGHRQVMPGRVVARVRDYVIRRINRH